MSTATRAAAFGQLISARERQEGRGEFNRSLPGDYRDELRHGPERR
jgi:hypothetical protein